MKTGELVKNIRTAKGIKAKTVYDNLLSRSMYYKYESGLVETTADTFLHILDRLNVESSEFDLLFRQVMQQQSRFHYNEYRNDLLQSFHDGNFTEVRTLEKKLERGYEETQLLRFYNLKLVATAMKKKLGHNNESVLAERKEITHYLLRSKHWGHYEYGLLSDAIFMFDSTSAEKLLQNHEWLEANGEQDQILEDLKIKTLCGAILLFMKANKKEHTAYYYNLLTKLNVGHNNIYARSSKRFFKGLKTIYDGDYEQGIKIISETFSLYQKLGLDDLYHEHVEILQELLSTQLQKKETRRRRKA
ncbi:helix-turn-helix domain-containing protein [Liquorilactobacillus capillatus]|uniref:Transcription regulator n=1 Tax=Liquorilactobacillus capillatus DSM 19910 TaxID=1423731 RepID=A0A0R1M739_9LACO|nr:Rgg/GadR/MutR family transcriptional regulator [Liquorilactobacillus capillatus]KRL00602.1 transcription regulator [Liquorilactobacillus capillatus DSM 19910]